VLKYDIKSYRVGPDPKESKTCHLVLMENNQDETEKSDDAGSSEKDQQSSNIVESPKKFDTSTADCAQDPDKIQVVSDGHGLIKAKMGFNLMSVTCKRGHFVDDVEVNSLASAGGLEDGDLLLKIEGQNVRDLAHEEIVEMLSELTLQGKYGDKLELTLIPANFMPSKCNSD